MGLADITANRRKICATDVGTEDEDVGDDTDDPGESGSARECIDSEAVAECERVNPE